MKHLFFATLALALSSCAMADDFKQTVNGTCPSDVKTIYVVFDNMRQPADSIQAKDGKFTYTFTKEKNTYVTLHSRPYVAQFFVDGTPVDIDLANNTIKGSELNNKLSAEMQKLDVYNRPLQKLYDQYYSLRGKANPTDADKQQMDEIRDKANAISEKADSVMMVIFNANKTNLIGASLLRNLMYDMEYQDLKAVLSADNELTRHPLAEPAKKLLEAYAKRQPGTQYTDIEENDVDGKPHKLSEWVGKGNYVMIDFWASWCGPCRAEMPNVVANYAKYHSKGFEIIGLSFDSKADAWKKAITDLNMPWIHLSDLKGWKTIASSTYGINSIPASILLDPQGKIVAIDLRGEKLGNKLKEIYGE